MKKILSLVLVAAMLLLAMPVMAADTPTDLPYITSDSVGFIDYSGADSASGASPDSAKKTFGSVRAAGVVGLLAQGGTMVASGKAYIGATYSLPSLRSPLLITSKYAGVDYSNPEPANNPGCAFKMAKDAVLTLKNDVIFDDIIVFQEAETQNSIVVPNGITLVIGKNVTNMTKRAFQVKIVVEAGGRLIVGGGDFEIENNGGEVIENYSYDYLKVTQSTVSSAPTVDYSDVAPAVAYIAYNEGSNSYDGLSASTPKKSLNKPEDTQGAMHIVRGGGTLVVPGRLYIGADYTIPKLGSELTITGKYNNVSFVDPEPEKNPAGGMIKMLSGKALTIESDVRFENIILFQEGTSQNKIIVANGATVTFGEGVEWKTVRDWNMALQVEKGGVVIFENGVNGFESISGDGIVIMPEVSAGFDIARAYDGRFTDVTTSHWFYTYVKTAYEYALANGTSESTFSPDSKFTVAQALTAAANIHTVYNGTSVDAAKSGEAWYVPYVNYCLDNNIITVGQFADVNKNITRGEMATVFANILPDSEYEAVRSGSNPDVTSDMACYSAVQKLYNAGIVGGDAATGNFRPNDEIVRSEACVIFTRIAAKEYRAK